MNPTGKKARRESGLNKAQLKRSIHTPKSEAKIKRKGWTRNKKIGTNARRGE